jgi:cytochrome c oxidase accessory protein FixG
VAVCPTGIDIRDGSQLECIQCALCIDACDDIMDRIHRPRGLIAYDTVAKQEAIAKGQHEPHRFVRPRTLLYAGVLGLVGIIMSIAWFNRTTLEVNVQRDRNPPYVRLSDGSVRNGYTVKILNKLHEPRDFTVQAVGLDGASLRILGLEDQAEPRVRVPTDALRELRVMITVPASVLGALAGTQRDFAIVVRDVGTGAETRRNTSFQPGGGLQ